MRPIPAPRYKWWWGVIFFFFCTRWYRPFFLVGEGLLFFSGWAAVARCSSPSTSGSGMSSMMGFHGVALATAVAVSGTVVLLGFCRQKSPSSAQLDAVAGENSPFPLSSLRSSISDSTKRTAGKTVPVTTTNEEEEEKKKKKRQQQKKKRVHFAEQVVELHVQADEGGTRAEKMSEVSSLPDGGLEIGRATSRGMPANRTALYDGILRDRHYRMA